MDAVDVHSHLLPPAVVERRRRGRWGFRNVLVESAGGLHAMSFAGGAARRVSPDLLNVAAAIARLDREELTAAVVAPTPQLMGYELPAEEGAAWASFLNEEMLDLHRDEPRLLPMATVPLQDGERAGAEVAAVARAGFVAVAIGTAVPGGELDDPALAAFWDATAQHGLPVFLHPSLRPSDGQPDAFGRNLANSVGRVVDTTVAVTRLLFSGVLAGSGPNVLVAHGGGSVPYIMGRLRRTHELAPADLSDPAEGFGRLYFDAVVYDAATLRFLVQAAGEDHVLLGSDYPFPNRQPDPRRFVMRALGEGDATRAVLGANAARLLGLERTTT